MKKQFLLFFLLVSPSAFSDSRTDYGQTINAIEAELKKIRSYKEQGLPGALFDEQIQNLERQKKKYLSLQQRPDPTRTQAARKNKTSGLGEKLLPSSVRRDLQRKKDYEDEALPLERRYELTMSEIAAALDLEEKLKEFEGKDGFEELAKIRSENKAKLYALLPLKSKLEALLYEAENKELSDAKMQGLRFGVMFDSYYQWSFNEPKRSGANASDLPYRNYNSRHNDFTVNLFELNVYKSFKHLELYADVDFGEQPEQNESVSADPVTHHLGQAFLRWRPASMENLVFTAGKFYSHFGLEVPKNIENKTYSRPFYFTLVCPFWHEGVALTQSGILESFGYGLYVYDKSDDRVDNDSDKTLGFQLNFAKNGLGVIYNVISGSEQNSNGPQVTTGTSGDLNQDGSKKTMHELIISYALRDDVSLTFDGVVGHWQDYDATSENDLNFRSLVGYVDYKVTPKYFVNLRYENFQDLSSESSTTNLFTTTTNSIRGPSTVDSYTLTHRYSVGNASEVRLEYRFDRATDALFPNETGGFKESQSTATLGWLYSI